MRAHTQRFREQRPSGRPAPKVRPERRGPVRVELISIGRELLRGRISDSNAKTLAGFLTRRGAVVRRMSTVDDERHAISLSFREALGRNPHLVISTGGLGPLDEDRTLSAVSDALGLPLALNHEAKALVEAAYQRLRRRKFVDKGGLTAGREKLCTLPVGSVPVPNPVGVSPGVICRLPGGAAVLCLPGMPDEMQAVLEQALPILKIGALETGVAAREIESPTADESALLPLLDQLVLEFPGVWITSRPAGPRKAGAKILISLEAAGDSVSDANATVDSVVKRLLALAAGSP